MSYTYYNNCGIKVTTEIRNGFKRFHYMNAQQSKFVIDDDGMPRFIVWQFISYATPLIQVVRDINSETWTVSCNGDPFSYSPSTTRQVTRWLNEHFMPFPFTVLDIREAYKYCNSITPDISTYWLDNITIDFHEQRTFHNVWR